ncbi:MAG: allantoinase AllB [Cyclobacteriaceae bacterium]|nr:allantoinase AllB [Cyclobacteriaceae bacterium]
MIGLHSKRVLVGKELVEATILLLDGKIKDIVFGNVKPYDFPIDDVGNSVIMPGLIDSHVHINEPGRTEWEGFDTATKAAAAGGITTLVEMPLNANPVTTTKEAFAKKLAATQGKLHVNCGFWGGIVPANIDELDALIESGVLGIKAFLTHSGIDEFPNVEEHDLKKGLPILKKHRVPLLVHAEIESPHNDQHLLEDNPTSYQAYLKSRPKTWEDEAIKLMIDLCAEFEASVHIVHLSSSNSIKVLAKAKSEGLPISVETCPHYLYFNAEDIEDRKTQYKCAPPIREKANNDLLWKALKEGLFSFIVSDHSPALPEIKELDSGNFKKAWGGIAGLQFNLPAFWTKAKTKEVSILETSKLMSLNVAKFLKIDHRKGKIAKGYDADLMVWDPEDVFEVTKNIIQFKHKVTPYEGCKLSGVVKKTFVRGHKVYDNGKFYELSKGKVLKRNE